jgi:hypothetical protein
MADNLLEHIGDLPQVLTQKDADFFEIEGTDGAGNPASNKESRLQLKTNMAASGPVPDMAETKVKAAAGIHDFEPGRFYRKGAVILRLGSLYRARDAFTSGTGYSDDDWERIPAGTWGTLSGDLEDQADLAAALEAKLDRETDYQNGVESRFAHESDGGGYFLEDTNDNSITFIGGNADPASPVKAELYAKNRTTGIGSRIIATLAKIFYTKNKTDATVTNGDELAVHADVADSLAQAKQYTDGKIAQLPKGAYYQGKLDYYGVNEEALAEFDPAEGQRALIADVDKIGTWDETAGAWVLADIAGLQEGFYWLVVDMGAAEKHYQGRVIYHAGGGWDINEDRQNMPDGVTLDYDTATGATKVADINETAVTADDTDFSGTVSGGFHAVLRAVFAKIRGLFALMAGKVNIQQHPSDAGKAMVIGSDGKLAPGVSGKVDAVDGVEPGTDKNVKLTYLYQTLDDYEADKASVPEGARVVIQSEYPDNVPNVLSSIPSGISEAGILGANDKGETTWLRPLAGVKGIGLQDTRDDDFRPVDYIRIDSSHVEWEFKQYYVCGAPFGGTAGFYSLQTIVPWALQASGGGLPLQIAYNTGVPTGSGMIRIRHASSDTTWGNWGVIS